MNLLQLVTILREDVLDDTGGYAMDWTSPDVEPLLRWTNAQCVRYLNESQKEAAKRSRMFRDASYRLNLVAGKSLYYRDPKIIQVVAASLVSDKCRISENESIQDIQDHADWAERTGVPILLCNDYKPGQFYVWPQPTADDTMNLIVNRYPLNDLLWEDRDCEIEFQDEYSYPLVYGAAAYAYLKDEVNTKDLEKSNYYELKFTEEFGDKVSTKSELMKGRRYPRQGAYGGIQMARSGNRSGHRNSYGWRNGSSRRSGYR